MHAAAARPLSLIDRRIFAVGLAGFSAFLDLYATQGLLPLLVREFHVTQVAASGTVSATTAAVALSAPLAGFFADTLGRKRIIVGAALALAIPTLAMAWATSFPLLLLLRFLQGLAMPAIFATTLAYVGEECEGDLGRAMASYVTGNILGGVVGRFSLAVAAEHWGWQAAFFGLGCANLLSALALWATLPSSRHFVRETNLAAAFAAARAHLKDPRLIAAYAVGFNILFSIVATFTYVGFYLAEPPFRLGTAQLGSIFLVYLAGALGTPLAGRLLHKVGPRAVLAAGMAAAGAGVLLTLIAELSVVLVGLSLSAVGIFACQSAANSYLAISSGRARSSAAGLYISIYYVGGTVGAILPGFAYHRGGWPGCVLLILCVEVATVTLALTLWKQRASLDAHGVRSSPDAPI